jgi:hypothetical protein
MTYVSVTDYFTDEPVRAADLIALARSLTRSQRPVGSHVRHEAEPTARSQPFSVEVSSFAAEMIERGIAHDGLEDGGPLLGVPIPGGVRIVDAAGTGSGDERRPGGIRFDLDRHRSFARSVMEAGFEGQLVGDWHLHPRRCHVEPSRVDRQSWARALEDAEGDCWVGLIYADDPTGLPAPRWAAWATTVRNGRPICERATLTFNERSN